MPVAAAGAADRIAQMTDALRLEPADEYPHPPDDAINFNESVYASGWDANQRMGGWMRLGNRVNEGYAELSVCLYLPDGRVACQFGRPAIERNDAFEPAGCATPSRAVRAPRDGLRGRADVLDDPSVLRDPKRMFETAPRADGSCASTCAACRPCTAASRRRPSRSERMYYGTHSRAGTSTSTPPSTGRSGSATRSGPRRVRRRDHSWGPRYWQAIWAYRLFIANFGPDRA